MNLMILCSHFITHHIITQIWIQNSNIVFVFGLILHVPLNIFSHVETGLPGYNKY